MYHSSEIKYSKIEMNLRVQVEPWLLRKTATKRLPCVPVPFAGAVRTLPTHTISMQNPTQDPKTGEVIFIGSKTGTALLKFAKEHGWADFKTTCDFPQVVEIIPFSS